MPDSQGYTGNPINQSRRSTMTRTIWAAVAAYIASITAANLLVAA